MEKKALGLKWNKRLTVIGGIIEVMHCLYAGMKRVTETVREAQTYTNTHV